MIDCWVKLLIATCFRRKLPYCILGYKLFNVFMKELTWITYKFAEELGNYSESPTKNMQFFFNIQIQFLRIDEIDCYIMNYKSICPWNMCVCVLCNSLTFCIWLFVFIRNLICLDNEKMEREFQNNKFKSP